MLPQHPQPIKSRVTVSTNISRRFPGERSEARRGGCRAGYAVARPLVAVLSVLLADAIAATPALAAGRSAVHGDAVHHAEEIVQPVELEPGASSDDPYDQYLALKKQMQQSTNFDYSLVLTVLPQVTANGGPGVTNFIYTPSAVWRPFTDTAIGSGAFNFTYEQDRFWTAADTAAQAAALGLNNLPSDWGISSHVFGQLTYTHTLPGNWLSVSVGQYSFGAYDANEYASDAQLKFINDALSQNASQTYANAGLGAYAEITLPGRQLILAGGFQATTDISGSTITTEGFATGKYANFLSAQWISKWLSGGTYSLLWYTLPAVPQQPSASQGVSLNAVQNLSPDWGLFLRANHASGSANTIETSVAGGAVRNDLLQHDKQDQAGLGLFWSKTNLATIAAVLPLDEFGEPQPVIQPVRSDEWGTELYYRFTAVKGLQVTPDVQIFFRPAFSRTANPAAVFTLRGTAFF